MTSLSFQQGCPQCGMNTSLLHDIDKGMKLRLEKEGQAIAFDAVCTSCFKALSKNLSNASYLAAEQTIQRNFKDNLWKNRLNLVKQARNLLAMREYAEAAICYEKYIKVVEYVLEKKRIDFKAQLFKDSPREVTILTGAFWSLVEIYDMHPKYYAKQQQCATVLAELMPYTNLFTSIIKRASYKRKHSKNPDVYKTILKTSQMSHGFCFIASVAYPDRNDPTVQVLRQFRNQVLTKSAAGRSFIRFYYAWSPGLANRLQHRRAARYVLRKTLPIVAQKLQRHYDLPGPKIKY